MKPGKFAWRRFVRRARPLIEAAIAKHLRKSRQARRKGRPGVLRMRDRR